MKGMMKKTENGKWIKSPPSLKICNLLLENSSLQFQFVALALQYFDSDFEWVSKALMVWIRLLIRMQRNN